MRAAAPSTYHSLLPSGTPPLLPIPLPSTSRRADIPEADTPPRKRLLLTTPRPECEVGESSACWVLFYAATRHPGSTIKTRLRDTERRMMTALELVNRRVTYQVDVCTRESSEFCTRHHDAQKDRAAVRAEIEVLRRERLAYEQESMETRQALAKSEAHCRALEARVTILETEVHRHEWQRQATDDLAVQHIMRTQALEAGARIDTLEDTENGTKRKAHEVRPTVLAARATTEMAMKAIPRTRVSKNELYCSGVHLSRLHEMSTLILQKIEAELWNLKVQGTDVVAYNQRFQELALLCDGSIPEIRQKLKGNVGGMPTDLLSVWLRSRKHAGLL
ncbi:hypothetical protein Tco_0261746 [Tanacetum coccineum]